MKVFIAGGRKSGRVSAIRKLLEDHPEIEVISEMPQEAKPITVWYDEFPSDLDKLLEQYQRRNWSKSNG